MKKQSPQSIGGQIMAKRQREAALKRYYDNPKICKQCGKIIEVTTKKVAETRVKNFCNHSCASKYNNLVRGKKSQKRYGLCKRCNCKIIYKKVVSKDGKNWGYSKRQYCRECNKKIEIEKITKSIDDKTLNQLYGKRKNYQSARSSIRKHAYNIYKNSGREFKCAICGYDLHVEICHIRPVSDFPKNIKVKVINYINNLVALCTNHHWELDNGHLTLRMGELKVKF